MKKIWQNIWTRIYVVFFILTLIGFINPYIGVTVLPIIQYFSIFIYLTVPIHLTSVFLLYKNHKRLFLLACMGLLMSFWVARKEFQISRHTPIPDDSFTLMSYNVQSFQFSKKRIDSVIKLTAPLHPDVICFQEFRTGLFKKDKPGDTITQAYVAKALGYEHYAFTVLPTHIVGTAIFSKYPIVQIDTLFMDRLLPNSGVIVTLQTPYGKIGVANVHLTSYNINQINKENKTFWDKWEAFVERSALVLQDQKERVRNCQRDFITYPFPLVVAGDLNAPPHSNIMYRFSKGLKDSFMEKGNGLGTTFPIWNGFGMRIDYQLYTEKIECLNYQIIQAPFSDHYATMGTYIVKKGE